MPRLTDETRNMLFAEHVDRKDTTAIRVTYLCAKDRLYTQQEYNFLVALANILMSKGSG